MSSTVGKLRTGDVLRPSSDYVFFCRPGYLPGSQQQPGTTICTRRGSISMEIGAIAAETGAPVERWGLTPILLCSAGGAGRLLTGIAGGRHAS
jgi:hypothetical protein